MPKRRELRRRRLRRSRFIDLDGDIYLITDRDAEGFEAVRLGPEDAEVVRRMRDENEVEMESAVLSRRP